MLVPLQDARVREACELVCALISLSLAVYTRTRELLHVLGSWVDLVVLRHA